MSEHMSPIPSRVYNAAVGGHVCGPEDVDFGQKVIHLVKYDRGGNEVSFESQVTQANKIYVIHDDFVLSSNVTIPANCVLEFDGGSVSGNNVLTLSNTEIIGFPKIQCILDGTIKNNDVYIDWFVNASSSNSNLENASQYIQGGFNIKPKRVIFNKGFYTLNNIIIKNDVEIVGRDTIIVPVEVEQSYTNQFHFYKNVFSANIDMVTPARVDNGVKNVIITDIKFIGSGCGTYIPDESYIEAMRSAGAIGEPLIFGCDSTTFIVKDCVFDSIENYVTSMYWPGGNFGTKRGILVCLWDIDDASMTGCEITNCRGDEQVFILAVQKPIMDTRCAFNDNYIHDEMPGPNCSIMSACVGTLEVKGNKIDNYTYKGSMFNPYSRIVTIKDNYIKNSLCSSVFDTCEYGAFFSEQVICENNYVDVKNSAMLVCQSKIVSVKGNTFKGINAYMSVNSPFTSNHVYPYFYYAGFDSHEIVRFDIETIMENNDFDLTNYDNTKIIQGSVGDPITLDFISCSTTWNNVGADFVGGIIIRPTADTAESIIVKNNKFKCFDSDALAGDPNHMDMRRASPIKVLNLNNLIVERNIFDGIPYDNTNSESGGANHNYQNIVEVYSYGDDMQSMKANDKDTYTVNGNTIISSDVQHYKTVISVFPRVSNVYARYTKFINLHIEENNIDLYKSDPWAIVSRSNVAYAIINAYIDGNYWLENNRFRKALKLNNLRDSRIIQNTFGLFPKGSEILDSSTNRKYLFSAAGSIEQYKVKSIPAGTAIPAGTQIHDDKYIGFVLKVLEPISSWDNNLPSSSTPVDPSNPDYKYSDLFSEEFFKFQGVWWMRIGSASKVLVKSPAGTFANRPISDGYTIIETGFKYMIDDETNNLHFPIFADVNGSTIKWYKADGTEYTV